MLTSTIRKWFHRVVSPTSPIHKTARKSWFRPAVESLEDRAVPAGFGFSDFSDISSLSLLGAAAATPTNVLRLTPAVGGQNGAAWFTADKQFAGLAFETTFQFQLHVDGAAPADGSDGFAFIIQNTAPTYLEGGGGTLGYYGLRNSLVIEFDTYGNGEYNDPSPSHISVHTNGAGSNGPSESLSLGSFSASPILDNGEVRSFKASYTPGTLAIYLDNMTTPKLTVAVDLAEKLNLDTGKAWIGFTAATGGGYQAHDIINWSYVTPDVTTSIWASDASVVEGNSGTSNLVFTINRSGDTSNGATVNWITENRTASAGDYTANSGVASFAASETQATVSIAVAGDTAIEASETIALRLTSPSSGGIVDGIGIGTILTDDVTVSIGDDSVIEGSTNLRILDRFVAEGSGGLATASGAVFGPDGNGDGAQDLYVSSGFGDSILRYDGRTGAFIDVFVPAGSGGLDNPVAPLFVPDGNLYVSTGGIGKVLRYSPSGAFLDVVASGLSRPLDLTFDPAGNLYIADRDTNQVYRYNGSVLSVFVTAGSGGLNQPFGTVFGPDGNLYVTSIGTSQVLRYNGVTGAFMNAFATTNLGSGPIWIQFGTDGYLYATVRTIGTAIETSLVRFNASTGVFVDRLDLARDGWAFVLGSDGFVYNCSNAAGSFVERIGPASLAVFTVSLSSASGIPVSVNYATASGTATAGNDYTANSGTLTFAPGETTKTILVQTLPDAVFEPDETFTVNLSNPSVGATITEAQGLGTIDDARQLFRANTTTAGIQYMSGETHNVASDGAGNVVVVWQGNGPGDADGVFFQRYDANANPLGGETLANIVTNTSQYNPVVGRASSTGKFMISWNSDPYAVFARVFNADGTPATTEITIATGSGTIPGTRNFVESIAVDADGDFVVLYRQVSKKVFSDTHYWQVQRYDAAGQAQGSSIRVASSIPSNGQGRVASDANGNFVVAWTSAGIHAQRFTNAGKKLGAEILVSATGIEANVGRDADGDFVVTWDDKAQIFNNDGSKRGGVITFAEARGECIAMQANGDFVLSWTQSSPTTSTDVYAQRFNLNGVAKEAAHRVNVATAGNQEHSAVAVANNGNYTVVWNDMVASDVWGRSFAVPAALMAASGPISGSPSSEIMRDDQFQPVLAEAIARWMRTDLTEVQKAVLASVNVQIADLGSTLGLASGNTIWLDDDAAGWGWFVDPTPWDDSEFYLSGDQGEQDRMDLLTVLEHELGHLLGYDHEEGGVMGKTLNAGTRESAWDQFSEDDSAIADWFFAKEKTPLKRKST